MRAVLLISHGSRSPETKKEIVALVDRLRTRSGEIIEFAFLELEHPDIPQGVDLCAAQGVSELVILLNFLNSGRHVDQDIPFIVKSCQAKYPQIKFSITKPIGQHPKIDDLFLSLLST
jgi:sirohydrochlorin ferrochelatase